MNFPIDVSGYQALSIDPAQEHLTDEQLSQLGTNIQIVRDTIIFFTAVAGAKGLGGHTGGAYDIVPEVLIADSFMKGCDRIYPAYFDEAGHRVAIQYAMSCFNGVIPFEKLLHYRAAHQGLYGHPELDLELGIKFSSGRLGHLWPFVNGVVQANPDKTFFIFGSDGSQMEGNDAEAARMAVAQKLNVKIVIDDNNVTIAGHPSEYMAGYNISKMLDGNGLTVDTGDSENIKSLYSRMQKAVNTDGPVALVNRRVMAPGVPGIEGSTKGHDVIKKEYAIDYLTERGYSLAVEYLNNISIETTKCVFQGSTREMASNRGEFGKIVSDILAKMTDEERKSRVFVIDSDLEGSTGINNIHQNYPDIFINGGIQERGNFSAAAGFGFTKGKQGIFSTFSAFLEMILSEATMARLNEANLLCHFSHAGIDDIADNTCHYGINIFFADNGLPEGDNTRLYFPADALQMKSIVESIWNDEGIRYLFSTRSKVPFICKENGTKLYENDYTFIPGQDEVVREGSAGYVVTYGEMTYRSLDAVDRARVAGIDVGLINKPTLNVVDETTMKKIGTSPFILVVEAQNMKTGLGSRFGTWLLQRGLTPKFDVMAVSRAGCGGLQEHLPYQNLDPESILAKIEGLAKS